MNSGRTVFAQLIEHLPHKEFQKCVARYRGDRYAKNFSCWDQYLAMAFAQFTYRESLRDIETCLGAVGGKLYHMGFRTSVARSTLADANESRDWRIYADFAQVLIAIARPLYARDAIAVDLEQSLYALDSTIIDLCLALFPWARFRHCKAAVKMTYAAGPARQYPGFPPHHRWQSARRERAGCPSIREKALSSESSPERCGSTVDWGAPPPDRPVQKTRCALGKRKNRFPLSHRQRRLEVRIEESWSKS